MSARDRLAAVLARALHQHVAVTSDPPHGWRCQHEALAPRPDHCVEDWADELVAAIPEPDREALSVGLLLEAIVEATPEGWHTVELKPNEPDFDIGDGTGWVASIAAPEWWEGESDDRDEHLRIGHGPSIHAALSALLDRLVAP